MPLIIYAYIADLVFGDPEWFPHPVRAMGSLIAFLDNRLRGGGDKETERIKGAITALIVIGASLFFAYLFIALSYKLHPFLGGAAWVFLGYTTLSIKDLRDKAGAVLKEIKNGSIVEARKELAKMVGRDTADLSRDRVIIAAVESIAESINDGIVAPLFYLILGGPVLGIAYKSINTLDSMLGYKNKKYLYFGWCAAKLDDLANFIPARISAVLISLASFKVRTSVRTIHKDGRKHPSPNSGLSEAAMAGALGIRLGGPSTYEGKLSTKPYLGENKRRITPSLINEALQISFTAAFIMVLIGVFLRCR